MIRNYEFVNGPETATPPTPSAPDTVGDILTLGAKTTFTLVNNQAAAANITGLSFNKATYRSFMLTYQIYRSASGGSTRAQAGILMGITDGTNWEISNSAVSVPADDDAGVDLSITSAGQLQYVSDDNGGSYSAANSVFEYELLQLMEV